MIDLDEMRKKRIVLFGAGKMAHNFLMLYENELPFAAIVDNNEALHGKRFCEVMEGLPDCANARTVIQPPSMLTEMDCNQVCVIVAVAGIVHQKSIAEQLKGYGVSAVVDVCDVLQIKINEILKFPIQKNKIVFQMNCHKGHDEAITEYLLRAFYREEVKRIEGKR